MQTGLQVTVTLPPHEVNELNKLVAEQKRIKRGQKYSRSQYVREALDEYLKNPTVPEPIPRTHASRNEFIGRKSVVLLLNMEHLVGIEKLKERYESTQIQVIRQAIIERAKREQGYWITIDEKVKVDPIYEDIWLRAADIYKPLEMKRNMLYQIAGATNAKWIQGKKKNTGGYEKEYNFGDIIRALKLTEDDIKKILDYGWIMGRKNHTNKR